MRVLESLAVRSDFTENPLPRPPPHIRSNGATKRSRRKDRIEHTWTLLRRRYPRHIRSRHNQYATDSSRKSRAIPRSKYPVRVKNVSREGNPPTHSHKNSTTQKHAPHTRGACLTSLSGWLRRRDLNLRLRVMRGAESLQTALLTGFQHFPLGELYCIARYFR